MKRNLLLGTLIAVSISFTSNNVVSAQSAADKELPKKAKGFFKPLPDQIESPRDNPATPEKVELGKKLFFDPRLSLSGIVSCNTCHNLATYGSDNLSTSLGHKFQTGGRNAPTAVNAGFHFVQFWDGRAKTLEDQAKGPILNPLEMAMPDEKFTLNRLKAIPEYVSDFNKAFKGEKETLTYNNLAKAIAAFERKLVTPSKFDKFLKGDEKALSSKEKAGLKMFMAKACITCHNGVAIGGGMFQKFGLVNPYPHQKDEGRFKVTKKAEDKFVFKVPSLRNINRTYPYFHDGKVWDLGEAIKIMGKSQLGLDLKKEEIASIKDFLGSLTGEMPKDTLMLPVLPPSTSGVSKPAL